MKARRYPMGKLYELAGFDTTSGCPIVAGRAKVTISLIVASPRSSPWNRSLRLRCQRQRSFRVACQLLAGSSCQTTDCEHPEQQCHSYKRPGTEERGPMTRRTCRTARQLIEIRNARHPKSQLVQIERISINCRAVRQVLRV